MAITYDANITTERDRIRLQIGDTIDGDGPRKPDDKNFSDAELDALATSEGSWQRTVAACYEILAGEHAKHTTFSAHGGSYSRSDSSRTYRELAERWRKKYGNAGESAADGIDAAIIDFSGDDVTPLFQVEQFGFRRKDWDSE